MTEFRYRTDIDGLRAIAVSSVIICHANADWLPGGFVGVDIFFVISGFLITSIIHPEINNNRFLFSTFYTRRLKRLMPAFFTVLFATLLTAILLFTAHDLEDLAKSARYATAFLSNFYFAGEMDYFAGNASEMPLLHTWSLAVEEQFYLIWPVVLLLILRFYPCHVFSISLAICLLSFGLGSYLAHQPETANWNFYLLPSRMGELLIGALLAVGRPPVRHAQLLAITGLILIVLSFILLNKHSVFPGYNSLWPTLGTALIIHAGSNGQPLVNRLLSQKPLVMIGLLSYSLYLWHWPILAFSRYYLDMQDLPLDWLAGCLLITVLLSWLSWRWVEQPARHRKTGFGKAAIHYFLIPTIIVMLIAAWFKHSGGYLAMDSEQKTLGLIALERMGCTADARKQCSIGFAEAPLDTVMFGDSHTMHYAVAMDKLAKQQHWKTDVFNTGGCPFLPEYISQHPNLNVKSAEKCHTLTKHTFAILDQYRNIIISLRWLTYLDQNNPDHEAFITEMHTRVLNMANSGQQVFLLMQAPEYNRSVLRHYKNAYGRPIAALNMDIVRHELQHIAAQHPNIHLLDFSPIIEQWQNGMIDGKPAYMDNHHLNHYGQTKLAEQLILSGHYVWLGKRIQQHGQSK